MFNFTIQILNIEWFENKPKHFTGTEEQRNIN